ncbi:MAG TPA: magnesium transporter, partial [Cellvibrionaceae bacterium]|nr:magnesium transporter [Cellvibrionaceae bacterium]
PHTSVGELQEEDFPSLNAEDNLYEAAEQVAYSGYSALPVLNKEGVLLGRIDMSTAVELLHEQAERQRMSQAGLAEDADLFAPAKRSARTRALWLGINLLTALLASWFIGLFGHSIERVVALAVLMPVVASMGGIAGSQTLTLVVRGLALGQVHTSNLAALFDKELRVGAINGVLWALVIGYVAWLWFGSLLLGLVIGTAVVVNIVTAAVFGVLLPVLLDRLRIDPALSGSVILTTITDIIGFVAFLGLGTLLLV